MQDSLAIALFVEDRIIHFLIVIKVVESAENLQVHNYFDILPLKGNKRCSKGVR